MAEVEPLPLCLNLYNSKNSLGKKLRLFELKNFG
jgi:hypothetical protein